MMDTMVGWLQPVAGGTLTGLLDAALKSSLLLVAAAGVTALMRNRSAAQRHLVWSVAVAAALAMPLLSRVAPRVPVPLPLLELATRSADRAASAEPAVHLARSADERPRPERVEADRAASDDPGDVIATEAERDRLLRALGVGDEEARAAERLRTEWLDARTRALDTRTGALQTRVRSLEDRVSALEGAAAGDGAFERDAGEGTGIDRRRAAGAMAATGGGPGADVTGGGFDAGGLTATLFGAWLLGVAAVLATLLPGTVRLRWIARHATPIHTGRLARTAALVATRLGLPRVPRIVEGDEASIPMTWGLKPLVLLPPGAAEWEAWRLEAVLLHELGHVARRDYLSQLAAHLACALYWFNPLVWIAAHRMRVEREHACDDLVVAWGREPARYAHDLLELARAFRPRRRVDAVALGMARPDHLRDRLIAVMDGRRSRTPLRRGSAWGTGTLGLAAALTLGTLTPTGPADAGPPPSGPAVSSGAAPKATTGVVTPGTVDEEPAREPSMVATEPPAVRSPMRELFAALGEALPTLGTPAVRLRAPQEAGALCGPADGESHSRSSLTNDGVRIIETEYGSCRSSIRLEGDLEFNEDFTRIVRLSTDGFLRLEVSRDGERRRLEARPGAGGRPEYVWSVDGRELPFDARAEAWLSDALLDLFRNSGFMAEERATWILRQEGPEGVLREVELMDADHAQARYLSILLERGGLSPAQVRRVIEIAGRQIESDHSLGEVLQATAASYTFDAATRAAFLEAARSLESDHQMGEVFRTALARGDLDQENLSVLLEAAAADIESDHTVGELLMELGARYPLEPGLREPFLRAAATLESDHQKGQVYGFVLEQEGLAPRDMAAILDAARTIESDHTLSQLLVRVAGRGLSDPELRRAFLEAARTIESSHNRGEVYRAALALDLTDEELAGILEASADIDSDHELASLLTEVGGRMGSATLQRAYLSAAARIGSDHNLSQTLAVLVDRDDLGEAEQIRLLEVARQIESDHNLADLLIRFARARPVGGAVRDAFLRTLEGVESEHQHGQVASVLIDRGAP